MAHVVPIFPTPIYTMSVADAAALNGQLRDVIERQRAKEQGVRRSNLGGWQSDIDMLAWGGTGAGRLAALATQACRDCIDGPQVDWRVEMWANVNQAGDSNQVHWHPGSVLSLVYYVDDGYAGSTDRELGGELVFIDPRMPFLRMRTPHLRHRSTAGQPEEHETWVRPFSGLLIGFPSFLGHAVRRYTGAGMRLSIAINMLPRGGRA